MKRKLSEVKNFNLFLEMKGNEQGLYFQQGNLKRTICSCGKVHLRHVDECPECGQKSFCSVKLNQKWKKQELCSKYAFVESDSSSDYSLLKLMISLINEDFINFEIEKEVVFSLKDDKIILAEKYKPHRSVYFSLYYAQNRFNSTLRDLNVNDMYDRIKSEKVKELFEYLNEKTTQNLVYLMLSCQYNPNAVTKESILEYPNFILNFLSNPLNGVGFNSVEEVAQKLEIPKELWNLLDNIALQCNDFSDISTFKTFKEFDSEIQEVLLMSYKYGIIDISGLSSIISSLKYKNYEDKILKLLPNFIRNNISQYKHQVCRIFKDRIEFLKVKNIEITEENLTKKFNKMKFCAELLELGNSPSAVKSFIESFNESPLKALKKLAEAKHEAKNQNLSEEGKKARNRKKQEIDYSVLNSLNI